MDKLVIVLSVIVIILSFDQYIKYEQNKELKSEVENYQYQIDTLKIESDKKQKQYEAAYQKALEQMRQIQDDNNIILQTKIPDGCNEAIKWGLNEASNFS